MKGQLQPGGGLSKQLSPSVGVGPLSGFCLSLAGAKAGESVGITALASLSIRPLTL